MSMSQTITGDSAFDAGQRRDRLRIALAVLLVLLPALQAMLLVYFAFGASLFDFVPATDDEVLLWHQELSFNAVGFAGGYYTYEEQPAAFSVSHFAAHGPFFPLLYGTLAKPIGWQPYTGVLLNIFVLTAALAIFVYAARPTLSQIFILGAVLLTFLPLIFEIPSNTQEALHLSFAIVMAVVFWSLIKQNQPPPIGVLAGLVVLILFVSLMRPFWALLLVPLAWLATVKQRRLIRVLCLAGALLLVGIVFVVVVYISAPYPNYVRELAATFQVSPYRGLGLFRDLLVNNIWGFLGRRDTFYVSVIERLAMVALVALLGISAGQLVLRNKKHALDAAARSELHAKWFSIYNLGLIPAIVIALYIPTGYQAWRVFAPYLLLTTLLLLLAKKYKLVLLVICVSLVSIPFFVPLYLREKARNFDFDRATVNAFADLTTSELAYDRSASPWCNTLLVDGKLFCLNGQCDYLLGVPAGRGLSLIFFPERLSAPLKSKYLLLGEQGKAILDEKLGAQLRIQPVRSTTVGTLYRNEDASCS